VIAFPTFDHVSYYEQGDVLYLSVGPPRAAADSDETPEGHIVRYDPKGEVVGVTLVNAQWLLERDGELSITLPSAATPTQSPGRIAPSREP
jgi:uncharacterized protein YuzE